MVLTPDHKGWYHVGRLPHCDNPAVAQFITFRLADALPVKTQRSLEQELRLLPENTREQKRRQRIEFWLDQGLGCCALQHAQVAQVMADGLMRWQNSRYRLLAWCIMPNHVHVLIEPHYSLSRIVQGWKGFTGRWVMLNSKTLGLRLPLGRLWMPGYWDRFIRDERHHLAVVDYIHSNPAKAGLCAAPEHWPWSSASRR